MDTSRKNCYVLSGNDLSPQNIKTTVKTIEHNPDKFYLLAANVQTPLWEFVEQLSKAVDDDNTLTKMRVAYDLKFDLQTVLKTGDSDSTDGIATKTFADLLDRMEFDENLNLSRADYHVIINDDGIKKSSDFDDEASRSVAKLFQQTVLLNIDGLDIQKKSELKAAQIKRRLRENYGKLLREIEDDKQFIDAKLYDTNLSEETRERANIIRNAFYFMMTEFQKAAARPIRIAAIGTKKAGKSVVINSLLKRDYAPTSATLPTPNTIVYVPAKDKNAPLTLEYSGKTYTFAAPEELKRFIGDEFKRAQAETGEGSGLPDMTITYPPDEGLNGYEVWDTPGPNVAFTGEHEKNAKERVAKADVCIFVMNYSNHLTTDEVKFLSYAHEIFQQNNKFYSLFIAVNRIDERYAVDEEKSVDRIIDYLGYRLERLTPPYKNIVLFATSALQKFYLDTVVDLAKANNLTVDAGSIDMLMRHKSAKTQVNFISQAIGNLRAFHDIENPTERELSALSGVPQLLRYVEYIGGNKADTEIVNSVVDNCNRAFVTVNNSLIVADLLNLTEEDKKHLRELSKLFDGLRREVDAALNAVRPHMDKGKTNTALLKASDLVKYIKRSAKSSSLDRLRGMLNNANLNEDDIKFMSKNLSESERVGELRKKVDRMISGVNNESFWQLYALLKTTCERHINGIEQAIRAAQDKISAETEAVKKMVTNPTAKATLQNFKTPEFPPSIDRIKTKVSEIATNLDAETIARTAKNATGSKVETRYRDETHEREADGIWETIKGWFGEKYYETRTVSYNVTVDTYDVERFKENLLRDFRERISDGIDEAHDMMERGLREEISKTFANANDQCRQIGDSYKKVFADFQRDVDMTTDEKNKHRLALERDIKTFNDISAKLQPFIGMWDDILRVEV